MQHSHGISSIPTTRTHTHTHTHLSFLTVSFQGHEVVL